VRRTSGDRRTALAQAALRVLASAGTRGLTHRAVDEEAGVVQGSVNYYAATRAALLEMAAAELFATDAGILFTVLAPLRTLAPDRSLAQIIEPLVDFVETMTSDDHRYLVLARFELLGESTRSPHLDEVFTQNRAAFIAVTRSLAEAGGCQTPDDHADVLTMMIDALIFRQAVVGPGRLDREQLASALARIVTSC